MPRISRFFLAIILLELDLLKVVCCIRFANVFRGVKSQRAF